MDKKTIEHFRKNIRILEIILNKHERELAIRDGLSLTQFHVLSALKEQKSISIISLSKDIGLDKSTISRTIDGLVKLNLVNRKENPANRRYTISVLTENGEEVVNSINRENNLLYESVLKKFPFELVEPFLKGFTLFTKILNKYFESGNI